MADADAGQTHDLNSEKAVRIVEAMRVCVARYGSAGATFDHVSKEAGVSRGLLHYYFGSKERLLIEVIRRETERWVDVIEVATSTVTTPEQLVDLLLVQLKTILETEPELYLLGFELIGEGRRHPEIGSEVAEHNRLTRTRFAEVVDGLREKTVIAPRHSSQAVAGALLAMSTGLALDMFQDPDGDHSATIDAVLDAALHLLGAGEQPDT